MILSAGSRLGPYEILATLGAGGMGEVYRARDTRLDRAVAIKVLPSHATSPQALERFEREAKAIAALNHPNICTIHDIGAAPVDEGAGAPVHFLVMELLEGETLHERLTRGPLDLGATVDVGLALADALAAAHARGVVHRDLKPANVMLTGRGPKILDFGLAKAVDAVVPAPAGAGTPLLSQAATLPAQTPLTDAGVTVGTVAYMSPEQLRGDPLDARTDIFSLGLVLYEMATGRRAFTGATSAVTSAAILHEAPTPPRQLRPDLPPRLEHAILTALEKDRELRTQTASELRAELTRITRESGVLREREPLAPASHAGSASIGAPTTASPASSSDAQLVAGLMRRHRGKLLTTVAALVLAAVGIGYLFFGRSTAGTLERPLSIADLQIEQLTTSGTADAPAISPDGKYVVYVERGRGDSLRVRQVTTGSNVEILPAEPGVLLRGATVTPDGSFIDYVRQQSAGPNELWRIPFLGGAPRRLLDRVASLVSWSPDGKQMAFMRGNFPETSLIVADDQGAQVRVVATRKGPAFFLVFGLGPSTQAPAWSPDGRTLAVLGTASLLEGARSGTPSGQIIFVDVTTGAEQVIEAGPPAVGSGLAWRDDRTLLVSMLDRVGSPMQIWQVSYPEGTLTRLTNDVNIYSGISLTADRDALVTRQAEWHVGVWASDKVADHWEEVVPPLRSNRGAFGIQWLGRDLVYTASVGTSFELSRRREETGVTEPLVPLGGVPSVSADGRTIIYFDFDTGGTWRMDADGGNRAKVIDRGAALAVVTADGERVVDLDLGGPRPSLRIRNIDGTGLRRVSPLPLRAGRPAVSNDGRRIVFNSFGEAGAPVTVVCDLDTCSSPQMLPPMQSPAWTADGRRLTYIDEARKNLWIMSLDGGVSGQLTHFPDDGRSVELFAWSADGERLAVARGITTNNIIQLSGLTRRAR